MQKYVRIETIGFPNPDGEYTVEVSRYSPRYRKHKHIARELWAQKMMDIAELGAYCDGGNICADGYYGSDT